jgi:hypothetical protein
MLEFPEDFSVLRVGVYDERQTRVTLASLRAGATPPRDVLNRPARSTWELERVGGDAEAEKACRRAMDIWSRYVQSDVTIRVHAEFAPMGADYLGGGGAGAFEDDPSGSAPLGHYLPITLANRLAKRDLTPGKPHIRCRFNSAFGRWYYKLDQNPGPDEIDFVTVVLHEIGHGLGFASAFRSDGSLRPGFGKPSVFDTFLFTNKGHCLTDATVHARPSALLAGVLQGGRGAVRFHRGLGVAARHASIYAPSPWEQGSSITHLDPDDHPDTLMRPSLPAQVCVHEPDDTVEEMLHEIGWR